VYPVLHEQVSVAVHVPLPEQTVESVFGFPKHKIGEGDCFGEGFGEGFGEDDGGAVWHWFPVWPLLHEHVSTPVQLPFPEQTVESVEAFPKQVTVWH
jgi:hypothetical protein